MGAEAQHGRPRDTGQMTTREARAGDGEPAPPGARAPSPAHPGRSGGTAEQRRSSGLRGNDKGGTGTGGERDVNPQKEAARPDAQITSTPLSVGPMPVRAKAKQDKRTVHPRRTRGRKA
ncbi:unnamed protein product [Prorocentrum cordatum]|uniref:Uncharacterized protein n=1 Tax=Prorocentrum cordatum TaxID=2364126 RepID=A0ABN9XBL9_9DINO|nr:unnamed protein product [Polarella glacialis]